MASEGLLAATMALATGWQQAACMQARLVTSYGTSRGLLYECLKVMFEGQRPSGIALLLPVHLYSCTQT
jgi:hypothetical protein